MIYWTAIIIAVIGYITGYRMASSIYFDRGYNACYMQLLTGGIKPEDSLRKCKEKLSENCTICS